MQILHPKYSHPFILAAIPFAVGGMLLFVVCGENAEEVVISVVVTLFFGVPIYIYILLHLFTMNTIAIDDEHVHVQYRFFSGRDLTLDRASIVKVRRGTLRYGLLLTLDVRCLEFVDDEGETHPFHSYAHQHERAMRFLRERLARGGRNSASVRSDA